MKNTLLILTLFALAATTAAAQTRDEFERFLEKMPVSPLPYITRTIEEYKISNSWAGTELEGRDTVFYSQPDYFSRDLWTVTAYMAERFEINGCDVVLYFLTGDSESGASISPPIMELCTYKNGEMIDRVWCGGGDYNEYNYSFYESIITSDGVMKVLEEAGESGDLINYDVRRTLRTYRLEQDGTLSLLSEEEVENHYSLTTLAALNDSVSVRLREITRKEYDARRAAAAHLRPKPYKAVTDIAEAEKLFGGRLPQIKKALVENYMRREFSETIYNEERDEYVKATDEEMWRTYWVEYGFITYYPEVDILIMRNAADGEFPIDLSDATKDTWTVGNPHYWATSPDKKLRINGYYPGGAADTEEWLIERWNEEKLKYEIIVWGSPVFMYVQGWFWTDNDTVLYQADAEEYLELTIIEKQPAQ